MQTRSNPISVAERIEIIDVLRGLAVCGILVGNMQWFTGYGMLPPEMALQSPLYDKITHFLVHVIVEGKFYSIFSFLFGFGFALQIARADERGDSKASVFKRRLFWLLVIGLMHGWLLWAGDILAAYAVMGFVLLLFRRKSNDSLLKWAAIMAAVPVIWYAVMYALFVSFAPPEVTAEINKAQSQMWHDAVRIVPNSSFVEIMTGFNLQGNIGRYLGLIVQMRLPKILVMFLLGFYAYRIGIFHDLYANRSLIRRVLIVALPVGIIGNIVLSMLAKSEADIPPTPAAMAGIITYAIAVPTLAIGMIALVATVWQSDGGRKILSIFAPVGRMALTNYLLQTIVCVLLFYGYGFRLYGTFGALEATLTAFAIYAAQIILSTIWLKVFAYGPMEWIWRQLTYRKRLPLRLRTGSV